MKKRLKKKMTTHYYCFRKNVNGKLTPHRYRRKKRYHCPRYAQWTYKHMYNPPRFEKHKIRELLADFELHEERGRYVFSRLNGAHLTLADDHLFNKIGLLSFPYIDFELGVILICLGILSEGEPWYDYYDDGSDDDVWGNEEEDFDCGGWD